MPGSACPLAQLMIVKGAEAKDSGAIFYQWTCVASCLTVAVPCLIGQADVRYSCCVKLDEYFSPLGAADARTHGTRHRLHKTDSR